mmetsp:Transcript_22123/g.50990  ORF Transcript_22123/g.50990 Transcript_22123/m.50990 type:complete len:229 (+) Transcript_22123:1648-2334(+)
MQCAFMGLVNHHTRITGQIRLSQDFSQEHSIRHVLNDSLGTGIVFKPDGVANFVTQLHIHLCGNSSSYRHGCNSPGLRAANFPQFAVAYFMKILWYLRCLTTTRLSNQNQDLVSFYSSQELFAIDKNRKFLSPDQYLFMFRDGLWFHRVVLWAGLLLFQFQRLALTVVISFVGCLHHEVNWLLFEQQLVLFILFVLFAFLDHEPSRLLRLCLFPKLLLCFLCILVVIS